jgi:hypothetical protein
MKIFQLIKHHASMLLCLSKGILFPNLKSKKPFFADSEIQLVSDFWLEQCVFNNQWYEPCGSLLYKPLLLDGPLICISRS